MQPLYIDGAWVNARATSIREIKNPATTAVYKPACGVTPEAIPNAIASGSATRPTVIPASRSPKKIRRE